jgi:hypothetical protein
MEAAKGLWEEFTGSNKRKEEAKIKSPQKFQTPSKEIQSPHKEMKTMRKEVPSPSREPLFHRDPLLPENNLRKSQEELKSVSDQGNFFTLRK